MQLKRHPTRGGERPQLHLSVLAQRPQLSILVLEKLPKARRDLKGRLELLVALCGASFDGVAGFAERLLCCSELRLLLVELALVYVPLVLVLLLDKCAHFLSLLQLFEVD